MKNRKLEMICRTCWSRERKSMDLIALILVVNVWIVIVHSLGKMNKVILTCSIFPPIYDIYIYAWIVWRNYSIFIVIQCDRIVLLIFLIDLILMPFCLDCKMMITVWFYLSYFSHISVIHLPFFLLTITRELTWDQCEHRL